MRVYSLLALAVLCRAGLVPLPVHARGADALGAMTFRVSVTGAARDTGTISVPQGKVTDAIGDAEFNGCGIAKNKNTQPPFGAYRFQIHVNYMSGINMMLDGLPPRVHQEVELEVANYRPGVSTYGAVLSLAFVIDGRLYFSGTHTVVTLRNGGLDGTISGRGDALRSYPSRLDGLSFQASWHCTTLFRVARTV